MKTVHKLLLGMLGGAATGEEALSPFLLRDSFTGSSGDLQDHNPDGEWEWDNYVAGGHTGVAWTIDGSGSAIQTDYPTAGEGTRTYYVTINVATSDGLYKVLMTTPSSGTSYRGGVIFRKVNDTNFWVARLNATNDDFELVEVTNGTETVRDTENFVVAANTQYEIVVDASSDDIVCTCNAVQLTYTSSVKQTGMGVGLYERLALNGGHPSFQSLSVEMSPTAGALANRIAYMPADAALLTEWDSEANSGVADSSVGAGGTWECEIDTTLGTAGTRLQFQCDTDGQRPVKASGSANKNLPDKMYFTWYMYVATVIERAGSFWLIAQMKQRDFESTGVPTISLNFGYNAGDMVTEINNNIASDGSYDEDAPDLSQQNFVVPVAEWTRFDMYYDWTAAAEGRMRLWMDNVELYDFRNIRTMLSEPSATWVPPQFVRMATLAHYAASLTPANSTIWFDNVAISVRGRLPDDYPVSPPI